MLHDKRDKGKGKDYLPRSFVLQVLCSVFCALVLLFFISSSWKYPCFVMGVAFKFQVCMWYISRSHLCWQTSTLFSLSVCSSDLMTVWFGSSCTFVPFNLYHNSLSVWHGLVPCHSFLVVVAPDFVLIRNLSIFLFLSAVELFSVSRVSSRVIFLHRDAERNRRNVWSSNVWSYS